MDNVLEFSFTTYKKAGEVVRKFIAEIMENDNISLRAFAIKSGVNYQSLLGFMNEKSISMSFKNMNLLKKYINKHYVNRVH